MPLVEQIANHLAAFRGRFNGSDRIIVWCGNNDVFAQFGAFAAVAAASFVERKIPICNAGKSTLITGGAVADGSSLFCNGTAAMPYYGVRTDADATN